MSRYFFLSLCLVFSAVHADEKTTANDAHDLAYSLGASLGERLRQEVPQLQIQALVEGLQQAYQGKPLALSEARIEQILADHESQNAEHASQNSSDVAMENEQRFLTAEKAKPGVKELADGILLTELTPGTGAKAGPDGKVQVLYVGRLPDGTVFDQNTQPQWFNLDSVIAGWRTALQN
ncbi:peptidylprolyl isomerase, partial [Pseudomonas sp. HMWF005]